MYCLPLDAGVNMDAWFEMMANIIHKELPEGSTGLEPVGQPESKDDRRAWPWWKVSAALLYCHISILHHICTFS